RRRPRSSRTRTCTGPTRRLRGARPGRSRRGTSTSAAAPKPVQVASGRGYPVAPPNTEIAQPGPATRIARREEGLRRGRADGAGQLQREMPRHVHLAEADPAPTPTREALVMMTPFARTWYS